MTAEYTRDNLSLDALADTGDAPPPKRGSAAWALAILEKHSAALFDADKPPPELDPILTLAETPVLTAGNVAVLAGQAGTAKSHTCAAIMAAAMAPNPAERDCLQWGAANPQGKAFIYLDFEQSPQDFHALVKSACRRAGVERPPEWVLAYNIVGMTPQQARDFWLATLVAAKARFGGVAAAIVDGIAYFGSSVNDEIESLEIVGWIRACAIEYQTGVLGILHLNPGSDFKTRGHLGSECERQGETILKLSRDAGDVLSICTMKVRHRPILPRNAPRFKWDDETGCFMTVESRADAQRTAADLKNASLAADLFKVAAALSYADAIARLIELTGKSASTVKRRLGEMRESGLVRIMPGTGLYHPGKQP